MKFIAKKQDILPALEKCSRIAKRAHMSICQNVLIKADVALVGRVEFVASDLQISLNRNISAEVANTGETVVNAEKLYKIIKEMPEEIIFSTREDVLDILSDNTQFELFTISPEEFPKVNFNIGGKSCDGDLLWEMITKVSYVASNNDYREALMGVLWEKRDRNLRMVASDGHRLAVIEKGIDILEENIILPAKDLMLLKGTLHGTNIGFKYSGNQAVFYNDNETISIRALDFEFPDYNLILNEAKEYEQRVVINREQFLKALKRVSLVADENKTVKLAFTQGSVLIVGSNPIYGKADEEVRANSNIEITFGMNAQYLIETLTVMESENVVLSFKDEESSVLVHEEGKDDYNVLIMPVSLGGI